MGKTENFLFGYAIGCILMAVVLSFVIGVITDKYKEKPMYERSIDIPLTNKSVVKRINFKYTDSGYKQLYYVFESEEAWDTWYENNAYNHRIRKIIGFEDVTQKVRDERKSDISRRKASSS